MNDNPLRHTTGRHLYSRRTFLLTSGFTLLGLAGCADQVSDRQFAGEPRTTLVGTESTTPEITTLPAGSPTAIPTSIPIAQLLAPSGKRTQVIGHTRNELVVIDAAKATGKIAWSNNHRVIWAADIAEPAGIALLTSDATSPKNWAVEFVDITTGGMNIVEIGNGKSSGDLHPDVVAGGRGGVAWLPDQSSVAISLPTGGLLQVFPDGSQIKLAKAMIAKRPSALAISPDGSTLAYIDQPAGVEGSGVYAGSMKAKPIDPIVVLPADRSGNRYARGIAWIGTTARVATIIDREELGAAQGDLFFLDTQTRIPTLIWTSPVGRAVASVESFAISPNSLVTAFLTNPVRPNREKPSSVWLQQTDGPAIERFDLPVSLAASRLAFTPNGVAITGLAESGEEHEQLVAGYLLDSSGRISLLYRQPSAATPVASPQASPVASPSPVAITNAG